MRGFVAAGSRLGHLRKPPQNLLPSMDRGGPRNPKKDSIDPDRLDTVLDQYLLQCSASGKKAFHLGAYLSKTETQGPSGSGLACGAALLIPLQKELPRGAYLNATCLRLALQRMLGRHPAAKLNSSSFPGETWARFIADKVRVMLNHARDLSRDPKQLAYQTRGCTAEEAEARALPDGLFADGLGLKGSDLSGSARPVRRMSAGRLNPPGSTRPHLAQTDPTRSDPTPRRLTLLDPTPPKLTRQFARTSPDRLDRIRPDSSAKNQSLSVRQAAQTLCAAMRASSRAGESQSGSPAAESPGSPPSESQADKQGKQGEQQARRAKIRCVPALVRGSKLVRLSCVVSGGGGAAA